MKKIDLNDNLDKLILKKWKPFESSKHPIWNNGNIITVDAGVPNNKVIMRFYSSNIIIYADTHTLRSDMIKVTLDGNDTQILSQNGKDSITSTVFYTKNGLSKNIHTLEIELLLESTKGQNAILDYIELDNDGYLVDAHISYITDNINKVQILSSTYELENVVRKDYIGNLEESSITKIDVLETSNKVSNNEVHQENIRTISDDKFILE